jgi:hypothetical protein
MRNSKFGLRAFGLAIMAALGLMAFTAVAAQAEDLTDGGTAGSFTILGLAGLVAGLTATGKQVGVGKLLVPGRNLTIECKKGEVLEGKLVSTTEATGTVLFKECAALVLSKETEEVAGCIVTNGKDITANAVVLAKLHGGELFLLFEPAPGKIFTTLEFESGKGCALPLKNEVKGTLAALDDKPIEEVTHLILFSQSIQKLLGDKLLFGTFESFVDGDADLSLLGTHLGCKWSVL